MRIVSLLPSATEIVCSLGLRKHLVGVTHECDFPPSVKHLPKVTRTLIPIEASSGDIDRLVHERLHAERALYSLDLPALQALHPDLVVTQTLCNVCAVAESEVRAAVCVLPAAAEVVNLEPETIREVFAAIRQVATAAGVDSAAEQVIGRLTDRVENVADRSERLESLPRVALLEWLDPPFSCGHWNPELVRMAGGTEGLGQPGQPSRRLDWPDVMAWQPDAVFVSCCGFSVERTLEDVPLLWSVPGWQNLPAARAGRIHVTDGSQYFSRPGPRLVDSLEILAHALHPEVHPLPDGLEGALRVRNPGRDTVGRIASRLP
ncbi:MAG: cobalamin-binding protein [Gammaproteobacteria bacterium]